MNISDLRPIPPALVAINFNATTRVYPIEPQLPEAVAERARKLIEGGEYAAAIQAVQQHARWEQIYLARILIGNAHLGLQQLDAADSEYQAADTLADRSKAVAANNRAMVEMRRRRYDRALELVDRAIDLSCDLPCAWNTKLSLLNSVDRVNEIEAALVEMGERWPGWRSDEWFESRLREDPQMIGIGERIAQVFKDKGV